MSAHTAHPVEHGIDAGSFRDRDGRIYLAGDRVLRGLSEGALADFRKLEGKKFYRRFADAGKLVATKEVSGDEVPLPQEEKARWAGFLEHDRVPVVSYAYEWTFSMLKVAASLQLHLIERAISNDLSIGSIKAILPETRNVLDPTFCRYFGWVTANYRASYSVKVGFFCSNQ